MTAPAIRPTVLKFGGAALADGAGVRRVCEILASRGGTRPIAVVSAALGVTELLDSVARAAAEGRRESDRVRIRHRSLLAQCGLPQELLDRLMGELAMVLDGIRSRRRSTPAERDFVLSFGERMSARIVAAALREHGSDATPVDAFDLGLVSDSNHGSARPLPGTAATIRAALESVAGIAVVTGFVAKDAAGNLTTLGRNGSDLSASLLGEAVAADEVQFWKTVGGVMTADPRIVPSARAIRSLSYAQAAEYATRGANVLHPDALAPLERSNVPARVACVLEAHEPGTRIAADSAVEGPVGIACRRNLVWARFPWTDDPSRRHAELRAELERAGIEPLTSHAGAHETSMLLASSDALGRALAAMDGGVVVERELACLSLVGSTSVDASALLDSAGVQIREHPGAHAETASVLVAENDVVRAACALHSAVFERESAFGAR
jgi:aspartate kinase